MRIQIYYSLQFNCGKFSCGRFEFKIEIQSDFKNLNCSGFKGQNDYFPESLNRKPQEWDFFLNLEAAAANAEATYRDEAGVDVVGAGGAWFWQQLHAVVVV